LVQVNSTLSETPHLSSELITNTAQIDIAQAFAAATRIQAMRPASTSIFSSSERDIEDLPSSEKGVKIELKDVSFKYPTRDVPVLQGVDMTVSPAFL